MRLEVTMRVRGVESTVSVHTVMIVMQAMSMAGQGRVLRLSQQGVGVCLCANVVERERRRARRARVAAADTMLG